MKPGLLLVGLGALGAVAYAYTATEQKKKRDEPPPGTTTTFTLEYDVKYWFTFERADSSLSDEDLLNEAEKAAVSMGLVFGLRSMGVGDTAKVLGFYRGDRQVVVLPRKMGKVTLVAIVEGTRDEPAKGDNSKTVAITAGEKYLLSYVAIGQRLQDDELLDEAKIARDTVGFVKIDGIEPYVRLGEAYLPSYSKTDGSIEVPSDYETVRLTDVTVLK